MKKIFLIILIASFFACNSNQAKQDPIHNSSDSVSEKQNNEVDSSHKKISADSTVNVQHGNEIHISFSPGSDSITVKGHKDSAGGSITCFLLINNGKKLTASIETKKPANIRFNQIELPNKQSEGPFGKELEYDLSKKGMYKIIIGSSLMADNPYNGDFLLHLKVK